MVNSPVFSKASLSALLRFPLRAREDVFQILLVTLVFLGLQIAFFPLALVVEAGYGMQVARRILSGDGNARLPEQLDWRQIFWDGLHWWGAGLLFYLPGLALWLATLAAAIPLFRIASNTEAGPSLLWWLFVVGWGTALFLALLGGELVTVSAMNSLQTGSFMAIFKVGEWWPVLRARFIDFELAALLRLGLSAALIISVLFLSIPATLVCLGPALLFSLAVIYTRLVTSALTAHIYRIELIRTGNFPNGETPCN